MISCNFWNILYIDDLPIFRKAEKVTAYFKRLSWPDDQTERYLLIKKTELFKEKIDVPIMLTCKNGNKLHSRKL